LYKQIIQQRRSDKNKIYSIHKPFSSCIAKGKAHKQYEFGNKIGLLTLLTTSKTLVINASKAFQGNPHVSKTIAPLLEQNNLTVPHEVACERGDKRQKMGDTIICKPDCRPFKQDTGY